MSGYISEFAYYGESNLEFIEVALPDGTDPSGYSVVIYNGNGTVQSSYGLGGVESESGGQDVYLIDDSTPGFGAAGGAGNFNTYSAVALIDGDGNPVQFLSYWGNTVTATEGPAAGFTSEDIGGSNYGESMQSDDGGQTYYAQSARNPGSVPACYAPGTQIATPEGRRPVEAIRPGDCVSTFGGRRATVRWVWSGEQPLDGADTHRKPVLIARGALGPGIPDRDLIVSAQHRIAVGVAGQLRSCFGAPALVPAKALTVLPGIRHMRGLRRIVWHHLVCDAHEAVSANGAVSETLLLGAQVLMGLDAVERRALCRALGRRIAPDTAEVPVFPCLTVGETVRAVRRAAEAVHASAAARGRLPHRVGAGCSGTRRGQLRNADGVGGADSGLHAASLGAEF